MTLPANPKERDIAVAGRRLPLTIREHSRATRLTLRIEPGGRALRMTVPPGISDREVERFLLRNNGWLSNRLGKALVATALDLPTGAALSEANVAQQAIFDSADLAEGAAAFFAKRSPEFVGR